jgi:hypothetical protein
MIRVGLIFGAISLWAVCLLACRQAEIPGSPRPRATATASAAPASRAKTPADQAEALRSVPAPPLTPARCGALSCWTTVELAAICDRVLPEGPAIIAFGEAHTRKDAEGVPTTARHFRDEWLPELARRGASEVVVELLKPAPGCDIATREVKREEMAVTREQASTNQGDYIDLGNASRELGVIPYLLEPDCDTYKSVVEAGPDLMLRMLEVIKMEAGGKLLRFWHRQKSMSQRGLVVGYGGAMHNDVTRDPDRAVFAFGAELVKRTGGAYVALDLIVPEYIRDSPSWRRLAWYPHFDASQPRDHYTLFQTGPNSYTLILPHTPPRPIHPDAGASSGPSL